jgi:hypothetical protein
MLGSGIVVSAPIFYVVTAAHVLLGFVDQVFDPLPPTVIGDPEAEARETGKRLEKLFRERRIAAVVESVEGVVQIFELKSLFCATDYLKADVAVLHADERDPRLNLDGRFAHIPMPMDFDELNLAEPYVIAGFQKPIGLPRDGLPFEEVHRVPIVRQSLVVRASRIVQFTTASRVARDGTALWRMPLPSEPGMSGGPLIRIRYPRGPTASIIGQPIAQIFTAVGIVSRGGEGSMFSGISSKEGETWITPIAVTRQLPGNVFHTFTLQIDTQIITYQDVEANLKSLPANFGEEGLTEYIPLLRTKMLRATEGLITIYLALMANKTTSGVIDAAALPRPKVAIAQAILIAIAATEDGERRRLLLDAYFMLPYWQPAEVLAGLSTEQLREEQISQERDFLRRRLIDGGASIPDDYSYRDPPP